MRDRRCIDNKYIKSLCAGLAEPPRLEDEHATGGLEVTGGRLEYEKVTKYKLVRGTKETTGFRNPEGPEL